MARRKIEVVIAGDAASLQRALGKAGGSAKQFGSQMDRLNGRVKSSFAGAAVSAAKFAAVTAGFYGAGAAITGVVKSTVEFDKSMRNVNSIAQLSEKHLGSLQKQVLKLAGKTAQAPNTLAKGLYDLVSSGFNSSQSMKILAASAKAATAGLTTTEISTKAVAAVLNAYHRPAGDAANISDVLFQTVNKGVISFEELAQTIGDVLPFASTLGISINEVGASVSTMTKAGISAPETMTRIKSVMEAFIKPSEGMAKAIKATGAESGEALVKQKGFQGALESVVGATDKSKSAVAKLFPNIRALGGAFALTGKNAKGAGSDLKSFRDVSGATDTALKQQRKSIAYSWSEIKAKVTAASIAVGSVFIPAMSKGLSQLQVAGKTASNAVKGVIAEFKRLKDGDKGGKSNPLMKRVEGPAFKPAQARGTAGAIGKMLSDAFKAIDWSGIADTLGTGISGAFTAIDWKSLGSTMAAGMSTAFDFTGKLPGLISSGIIAAINAIDTKTVGKKFAGVIAEAIGTLADPGFWVHHLGALFATITVVIPIGKIFKIPGFGFLYEKISKPFFSIVSKIGSGLVRLFGTMASRAFIGFINELEKVAPKLATTLFRLLNNGILKPAGSLAGKLGGLAKRAGAALAGKLGDAAGALGGAAGKLVSAAIKGIGKLTAPFRSKIGSIVKGGINAIHDFGGRFLELGKNLIMGLVNGIKNKAKSVANAAKDVAKGAVDKVKGFLGIKSPSTVFHGIGQDTMAGYIGGLLSKKEAVTAGLNQSLLFPIDAAIAALNDKKDQLQKSWDAIDARAQRSELVAAVRHPSGGSLGGSGGGSSSGGSSSGSGGIGWAKSMVGHFKETGFNTGSELNSLEKEFGMKAQAWCAMFATKALVKAGAPKKILTASVASINSMAQRGVNGLKFTGKPKAGNLMTFGNKHVGVVESVDRAHGVVHTIEGNTSAGKVSRGTRAIGSGRFVSVRGVGSAAASAMKGGGSSAAASKEIARNEQKIYDLRKKTRDLPAGKKSTAERKQIQDEIAALLKRNKTLKATVKGSSALADAKKALKDFDTQAKRAAKSAKIDLQIKNLEQLRAFKDAIKGARDQMKDLASQAAQAWRAIQEKRIDKEHDAAIAAVDGSAQSLELQGLQQKDAEEQDRKTKEGLDADYAAAKLDLAKATTAEEKKAAEKAIKDAEDALEAYKRGKREEELRLWIENEKKKADDSQTTQKDGLDQQTIDYEAGLVAQFDILTTQLENRKIAYSTWAKQVSDIVAGYGLTVSTDSGTEGAITAGPGAAAPPLFYVVGNQHGAGAYPGKPDSPIKVTSSKPQGKPKGKAAGGWTYPGQDYWVGETGPERFTPAVRGHITPASRSGSGNRGGGGVSIGEVHIHNGTDIDRMTYRLARALR